MTLGLFGALDERRLLIVFVEQVPEAVEVSLEVVPSVLVQALRKFLTVNGEKAANPNQTTDYRGRDERLLTDPEISASLRRSGEEWSGM